MVTDTRRGPSSVILLLLISLFGSEINAQSSNETRPAGVDCQQQMLQEVYRCVSESNINFNTFISVVGHGQNVSAGTSSENSNITVFKDKICSAREQVMKCIVSAARTLIISSLCMASKTSLKQDLTLNDHRFLIKEQVEAIVGQYDVFCAHACRVSLMDDMRACYTKFGLDPRLFLSTEERSPVIGTTPSEVDAFCRNSHSIVTCLKKTRDDCHESHVILSAIGLDLDLMNKGFHVLCNDQETYMKSLDCFDTHTKEVEYCQSVKYRSILAMAITAREDNWTGEKYNHEVCGAILNHIQCDLDAWAAKEDGDCSENTLSLKRKLHCALIPSACQAADSATLDDVCTVKHKSTAVRVPENVVCVIFVLIINIIQIV